MPQLIKHVLLLHFNAWVAYANCISRSSARSGLGTEMQIHRRLIFNLCGAKDGKQICVTDNVVCRTGFGNRRRSFDSRSDIGSRIFLCCRFLRSGVTPLDATRAIFTKGSSEKYHVIWNAITDFVDFRYFWWSLPERVIRILRESDGRRSWNRSDVGRNRRRAPITRSSYRQANLSGRSGES